MSLLREPALIGSPSPTLIVPPAYLSSASAAAWPAVNRALLMRFELARPMIARYINWRVDTQGGNVQVGVSALSGPNYATQTRLMDSGIIACPAAGDIHTDLGATLLLPGAYCAFLWADNITFQTRYGTSSGLPALRVAGNTTPGATGIPTSGAFAWGNQYVNMTVEAA